MTNKKQRTTRYGFRTLTSPIHFHTARLEGVTVLVFQDDELIGSGRIEEITESTVTIGGEYFLRENCTFTYSE